MLIKIGYDIALRFPNPTSVIHLLHVHPSRRSDLIAPEHFSTEPALPVEPYYDNFGNHRGRLRAPAGTLRIFSEAVIRDSGSPDAYVPNAAQLDISEINAAALEFLLPSRYCEVDSELMVSPGKPFRKRDPDGVVFKRFATLSMNIFNSIISKLVPIELHLKLLGSESAFAEISRI